MSMRGNNPSQIKRQGVGSGADPYLSRAAPKDKSVCSDCHAIYHNKHWALANETVESLLKNKSAQTVCPACMKIRDHYPSGLVKIQGNYVSKHKQEIINLIRNEEKRARGFNPLERIMKITSVNGHVEVETTSEKLAQRIGNRLHRAHNGSVRYQWSNDHYIRVDWNRNDDED